jgi:hypothetical protein
VALGDTTLKNMTAVPYSVFGSSDVRLRIWFNDARHGWQQLAPDQRIVAVGYAMTSAVASYAATSGTAASVTGTILGSQVSGTVPYAAAATTAATAGNALQLGGTSASNYAQVTGTYAGMTAGTAQSLFGSAIQDTGHLPGMNNDWHSTFNVSGSGILVASGSGFYLASGSNVTLASGATTFALSGSNSIVGGVKLSGTTFSVKAGSVIICASQNPTTLMSGVNGPTLSVIGNGGLVSSGTDDWATFQALLNSATNGQSNSLTLYVDSDFALSNTPIIRSNTTIIGLGGHMWHMNGCNEPGIGTVLTGAAISSSNITIQNLTIDCNAPEQSNVRLEGGGFLQGTSPSLAWWVFGGWFGSCTGVELDNLTMLNAGTFSLVWSNASNVTTNQYRNIWTNQESPPEIGGMNHDGMHFWGPCNHFRINNSDLMGDDDAFGFCNVENTPEGAGVGSYGAGTFDARRGNGGPITDIEVNGTFLRNAWDFFRLEGFTLATGTAQFENTIDNVSFLNTTGTTYNTNDNSVVCNQIKRIEINNYGVVSGSSVGANGINLPSTPYSDYELSNIAGNVSVIFWPNNFISVVGDPNTWQIGGDYEAEIQGLRGGCVAAWSFNTDTSGSAAYDWTGNGATLSNTTSVVYASGTMTENAAIFNGTDQFLYVSGTACPNIATMKQWTIAGWAWHNAATGTQPAIFTLLDGTTPQIQVLWAPNSWSNPNGLYADVGGNNMWPGAVGTYFPNGHWCFFVMRMRPADGAICAQYAGPGGLYSNGWVACTITGTAPKIEIGGSPEIGTFMAGMVDNVEIWNRCLTNLEVARLNNPGTDGMSYAAPPYPTALYGGREWPFDY